MAWFTVESDGVVVGVLGKVGGSVDVSADEGPAKHLSHGRLEHGVEFQLLHHRKSILHNKDWDTACTEAQFTTNIRTFLALGYSTSGGLSLLRGRKVTSPGSFCLFMMDRIWEAVRSESTIT